MKKLSAQNYNLIWYLSVFNMENNHVFVQDLSTDMDVLWIMKLIILKLLNRETSVFNPSPLLVSLSLCLTITCTNLLIKLSSLKVYYVNIMS